jgi:AraC family transcriptional regulator of adaptative response / methylphosphotriester-DNA alkyltransferase methyltransferase
MVEVPSGYKFYGVSTTRIFCRSDCPSKTPKKENLVFFKSGDAAKEQGFRSCKRCRPLIDDYLPSKKLKMQMISSAEKIVLKNKKIKIGEVCTELHISERHLRRVFQELTGTTPSLYLKKYRK